MMTDLQIKQSQQEARVPVTVFELAGELNSNNVQRFQTEARQALDAGTRYVMLDLSQLTYISSGGLRALFVLAKALSAKDGTSQASKRSQTAPFKSPYLKLLNPTPHVRKVLESMGFTTSFEIYGDQDTALRSF